MDISAYRKTYFALCRELDLDPDTRHDFNQAQTGKASTTEFSVADWRHVVAELQRRSGMDVAPSRPHIRGRKKHGATVEAGDMITPAQLELVCGLATQIEWRVGLPAYIRSRLTPLRQARWDGRLETLFRAEARNLIPALRRMARRQAS